MYGEPASEVLTLRALRLVIFGTGRKFARSIQMGFERSTARGARIRMNCYIHGLSIHRPRTLGCAIILPMTTKQLALGFAVILLAGLATFRLGAQQETSSPFQRYTLQQFDFQTQAPSARLAERAVFKIDTTTGRSWRFVSAIKNGNLETYWDPIDELQRR